MRHLKLTGWNEEMKVLNWKVRSQKQKDDEVGVVDDERTMRVSPRIDCDEIRK